MDFVLELYNKMNLQHTIHNVVIQLITSFWKWSGLGKGY